MHKMNKLKLFTQLKKEMITVQYFIFVLTKRKKESQIMSIKRIPYKGIKEKVLFIIK